MNKYFLIIVFCVISNVTCFSMNARKDINLDEESTSRLLTQVKKEVVNANYWLPTVERVSLTDFYLGADGKYHVRAEGSYAVPAFEEDSRGNKVYFEAMIRKPVNGTYSRGELEGFGVKLPE